MKTAATYRGSKLAIQSPLARLWVRRALLFFAILISGGNLIFPRIPLVAGLGLTALLLVSPFQLLRRELALIWLVLGLTAVAALIGGGAIDIGPFLTRYVNFLAALLVLAVYLEEPRGRLEQDISPLLAIFAAQAIITPILALALPQFFSTFRVDQTIYHSIAFIFTYHENIVTVIKRPDGFFFEPGVLQIYLNIYLYIALFHLRNRRHSILAFLSVLATQSTTGFVILSMICGFYVYEQLKRSNASQQVIVLVLAPVALFPIALIVGVNLEDKLFGTFSGSRDARQFDLMTGLRIAMEYPLTGIGFDHQRYLDVSTRLGYFDTAAALDSFYGRTSSNGILTVLYMIGIPMFLVYMYALAKQRFFRHRALFAAILFLSFLSEALVLTPFFLMIIFSGLLVAARKHQPRVARIPQGRARAV